MIDQCPWPRYTLCRSVPFPTIKVSAMSSTASPSPAALPRRSNATTYLVAGCGLLSLCAFCAGVAGAGYYLYKGRSIPKASAPSVEDILDATQRMAQMANGENDTRLNVARGVLAEIVRPSDSAVTAGLPGFGTGARPAACSAPSWL